MPMMKKVPLPREFRKEWEETTVALLWSCPAFSHILYTMMGQPGSDEIALFTDAVPVAATDGSTLIINPAGYFKYNLYERVFIIAHEVMHCVYNHCGMGLQFAKTGKVAYPDGTTIPYDQDTMNIALDYVVNALLVESKVGTFNKDWLLDTSIGTHLESGLDVYRKLYKQDPPQKGKAKDPDQPCRGGKGGAFDEHLQPGTSQGKDPTQAQSDRSEAEWQGAVAAAANAARAQGKLPAALDRALGEILDPQVDWQEHIEALFARRIGSGRYDFRRMDRRLICRDIIAPGRSGYGAELVIVGADSSGSVTQGVVTLFMGEIAGMLSDIRPKTLLIVWCDAKVHRVDDVYDPLDLADVQKAGAPGGGGTDFRPVFDWIKDKGLEPDALVYLTDGYGSFPDEKPKFPCIWGNIIPGQSYPFGDVVDVPVPKR